MIETLPTNGEVLTSLASQKHLMGEMAIVAATPEADAPAPSYVDVELNNDDQTTDRVRAWYLMGNNNADAVYAHALQYGKEHRCTVVWGVAKPQMGNEGPSQRAAIIFERDTLLGDHERHQTGRQTLSGAGRQAVADSIGDGYEFDTKEFYHQDVWETGVRL
jgi:hypothetical protein